MLLLAKYNKDYAIFSYFCNFVAKSDQKPKTKNGMNETQIDQVSVAWNGHQKINSKNLQNM